MRPGQVRNAFISEREVREDAPPCRIGQRRESAIQHLGGIFNHLVNYVARECRHANKKFQQLLLNDLTRINESHLQMACPEHPGCAKPCEIDRTNDFYPLTSRDGAHDKERLRASRDRVG